MLRIVVTVCALSQLATAYPQQQRGVVAGRPAAGSPGAFGPNYSQQLAFGHPSQVTAAAAAAAAGNAQVRRLPSAYQSPQPIILSQGTQSASPATPSAFSSFPGANPFGGAGRQILTLRSPQQQADEDEYEYEDDDEPTLQGRPSPRPSIPVTRGPTRASPSPSIPLGAVPGRFNPSPQQQQQQVQRQRVPQAVPVVQQQHAARIVQANQRPLAQDPRGGSPYGIDGKRNRLTTPPPIQTVNRYMKQNDDGSITWGYENEDGTFKEETLGADCVVRGKYGYIDPEGNKREYEYQTGNPCDPNKRDQEEELEEDEENPDAPSRQQQIAGLVNARPRPVQRRPIQAGQIPQYQPQPQYQ